MTFRVLRRGGRVARAGTTSEDEGADEAGITSRETKRLGRALEIVWLHRQGVLASVRGDTSRGPLRRPARPSRSRASKHASRSAPHVPPRTSSATTTLMRPSDQPPSEGRHLAAPRGGARRDVLGVPAPRADATPSSRARQPRPPVSPRRREARVGPRQARPPPTRRARSPPTKTTLRAHPSPVRASVPRPPVPTSRVFALSDFRHPPPPRTATVARGVTPTTLPAPPRPLSSSAPASSDFRRRTVRLPR